MSDNGHIRWVPLDRFVTPQYGTNAPGDPNGDVRVIGMTHISGGRVDIGDLPRASMSDRERDALQVHEGDVLFNRTNSQALVGKVGIVPEEPDEPTVFASYLVRLRCDPELVRSAWVNECLNAPVVQRQVHRLRTIGVSQSNINPSAFCADVSIPVPPLPLQDRVLAVLGEIDGTTQALDRLIGAKGRLRDGLAQALLTGRRRLPAFAGREWRGMRIGEVTRELTRRNGGALGADRVMAVNKTHGMIPMRERTIADDLNRYKFVPPGAFAYNPMRINIGSIARSHFQHDTLVSPDYVVFECSGCDPRYLDWLRRTPLWRRHMTIAGNGGVRVRIYYDDLALMKVHLPGRDEQSAIADILDAATREINALTRLREAVAKQKRGLMQQLLTGRLRVPEVSDAV